MVSVGLASASGSTGQSAGLSVSARSGWAFTAASAQYKQAGPGTGACSWLTVRPTEPQTDRYADLGESCLEQGRGAWTAGTISGGPNNGYKYVPSAPSNTTIYQWVRTAGLDSGAVFYGHQIGSYNAQSNPGGCISGAQLATNVERHEAGSIQGHWGNYKTSQDLASNNVGTIIESSIGTPSETQSEFQTSVNNSLNNAQGRILSGAAVEPWSVHYDATHTFKGFINWAPAYNSCD